MHEISKKIQKLSEHGYQTHVVFEVTNRCNARCEYCYVGQKDFAKDLPTEKIFLILDKIADENFLFLTITGGEPFLRPDILPILYHAVACNFFSIAICTNAILIGSEQLNFLEKNAESINRMQISIFSDNPEINDSYFKVNGAYRKAIKNAELIKSFGIEVSIALNLINQNIDHFQITLNNFKRKGFKTAVSYGKQPPGCGDLKNAISSTTSVEFYSKALKNADQHEIKRIIHHWHESERNQENSLCIGLKKALAINASGQLIPCVAFRDMVIGEALQEIRIRDIMKKCPEYQKIVSLTKNDLEKCKTCRRKSFCNICIGSIHSEYGKISQPLHQSCNFCMAVENYVNAKNESTYS
ncbi:MAG: radical SAM protein [Chitinivibrionales bacterium]|nr:radical SAM protein [Chitinivibrionales bacterium]